MASSIASHMAERSSGLVGQGQHSSEDELDPPGNAEPQHRATIEFSPQLAGQMMLHSQRHCLSPRDSAQLAEDTTHVELDRRAADV